MNRAPLVIATALFVLSSNPTGAGVFLSTVTCSAPPEENFCLQGMTRDGVGVTSFGVVHPMGYDGVGGALDLKICVSALMNPDSIQLIEPTKEAVRIWNDRVATTEQCKNCFLAEDANFPPAPAQFHAATAILHELGHCAMGLDHPNLEFDPPGSPDQRIQTSFTMSYDGSPLGISEGDDGIQGSFDDGQVSGGGAIPESVHWFRIADNNPVIVDETVIDVGTYSRSIVINLPEDHGWAANANRDVAAALGFLETQTVMYTGAARTQRFVGLTADDVNMVKMGQTGQDLTAGTIEDYDINLEFIEDCSQADIIVTFDALPNPNGLGACSARVVRSFPQPYPKNALHYSVVPGVVGGSFAIVALNTTQAPWDLSVGNEIFTNGFESGDTSAWNLTIP